MLAHKEVDVIHYHDHGPRGFMRSSDFPLPTKSGAITLYRASLTIAKFMPFVKLTSGQLSYIIDTTIIEFPYETF